MKDKKQNEETTLMLNNKETIDVVLLFVLFVSSFLIAYFDYGFWELFCLLIMALTCFYLGLTRKTHKKSKGRKKS